MQGSGNQKKYSRLQLQHLRTSHSSLLDLGFLYFFLPVCATLFVLSVPQGSCPYLQWDLCGFICLCLALHLLTFSVGPSVSPGLALSPWPVWSVIEGAVFTWPTGIEGTLCALWRQIALLAPPSQYLSFTFLLLLLLSSYSAHTLTTLLVKPSPSPLSSSFPSHFCCLAELFRLPL